MQRNYKNEGVYNAKLVESFLSFGMCLYMTLVRQVYFSLAYSFITHNNYWFNLFHS